MQWFVVVERWIGVGLFYCGIEWMGRVRAVWECVWIDCLEDVMYGQDRIRMRTFYQVNVWVPSMCDRWE